MDEGRYYWYQQQCFNWLVRVLTHEQLDVLCRLILLHAYFGHEGVQSSAKAIIGKAYKYEEGHKVAVADALGIGKRTFWRAIEVLENQGYITATRNGDQESTHSSFRVKFDVVDARLRERRVANEEPTMGRKTGVKLQSADDKEQGVCPPGTGVCQNGTGGVCQNGTVKNNIKKDYINTRTRTRKRKPEQTSQSASSTLESKIQEGKDKALAGERSRAVRTHKDGQPTHAAIRAFWVQAYRRKYGDKTTVPSSSMGTASLHKWIAGWKSSGCRDDYLDVVDWVFRNWNGKIRPKYGYKRDNRTGNYDLDPTWPSRPTFERVARLWARVVELYDSQHDTPAPPLSSGTQRNGDWVGPRARAIRAVKEQGGFGGVTVPEWKEQEN